MRIENILNQINNICSDYDVTKIILYGSFAKGTNRKNSDLDIAICCREEVFDIIKERIYNEIETLRKIDLLDYNRCKNNLLIEDIEKYGKIL